NEGLQTFMNRLKSDSSHIKGVPPVLRISAFMHGHSHPELVKKLNDRIPKTVDEMFERVRAFIRGEVAARSAEMVRPSQGDKGNSRLVWSGVQERARNRKGTRIPEGIWECVLRIPRETLLLHLPRLRRKS
nr:reverse transcriptase domain-containing protein [Tanacetum cinerariifolium]